jgi:hypothetical protein
MHAHHPMILSGFERVQVDPGDTRLNNYILEHGYRRLWGPAAAGKGAESLWDMPFFHPKRNTAAYGDLLLGAAPFYWVWRWAAFPPDTSFQLWMLTVTAANSLAGYLLLRGPLKLSRPAAAAGAVLFACGNSRIAQLNHQQLLSGLYVVAAVYALLRAFEPGGSRRVAAWIAVFFAAVVAQLYTGYYVGFFLLLALLAALAWSLASRGCRSELKVFVRAHWRVLAASAALAGAAMVPWLRHYLPAAAETGLRPYGEVRNMLPRVQSWFYMGRWNWLYGRAAEAGIFARLPMPHEHALGLGLLTTAAAAFGLWRFRRERAVRLAAAVALTLMLLTLWLPGGWSLWWLVHHAVPGAGAIRAVARVGLLLLVPASMGLAMFVEAGLRARRRLPAAAALLLAVLCLIEQGQTTSTYDKRAVRDDVRRLAVEVRRARAEDCRAFIYLPAAADAPRGGCTSTPCGLAWRPGCPPSTATRATRRPAGTCTAWATGAPPAAGGWRRPLPAGPRRAVSTWPASPASTGRREAAGAKPLIGDPAMADTRTVAPVRRPWTRAPLRRIGAAGGSL